MTIKQFILLGPPGIDVEAHASAIAQRWAIASVSMAALGRGAAASDQPLSDEVAMTLLRRRLEQPDAMLKGWVLAGFPENLAQAQALEEWLARVGQPVPTVVHLKAMAGLLLNRLWTQRGAEDTMATIRQRLEHHGATVAPVLEYYGLRSQLETVNGTLPFAEVTSALARLGQEHQGAAPLIQDEGELDALIAKKAPLVVDCMASWCGACRQVTPLIDQLATAYGDQAKVMKIDFDANQHITQRFGLKGMPAVMFFKDGHLQETLVGVKPYRDYNAAISRCLD